MKRELSANQALHALREVQYKNIEPAEAVRVIVEIIQNNLKNLRAVENSINAGQVANLMAAELFPNDPMSKLIRRNVESGLMPELSNEIPHRHSIYRATAVFASLVSNSWSDEAPRRGGKIVDEFIESSGYLPSEVREY